jgi:hypothetical protein
MVYRKFHGRLLDDFLPALDATTPEATKEAIQTFMQERYTKRKRKVLAKHRNHVAMYNTLFDLTAFLPTYPLRPLTPPNPPDCDPLSEPFPAEENPIVREESDLMDEAGWERFPKEIITRLRAHDKTGTCDSFPGVDIVTE